MDNRGKWVFTDAIKTSGRKHDFDIFQVVLFAYQQGAASVETERTRKPWHDIPFSPRDCPFFYGWVIVAASVVGTMMSIPGQTMGVGVFSNFLEDALGLTKTKLTYAYMFGTITSGCILPFAGTLMDRIGTRAMIVVSSLGLGCSLALCSVCDRIVFGGELTSFAIAMTAAYTCFVLIRFFGQGCMTMTSRVSIGKWFNHRRGLATGLAGIFISIGFNGSPYLLNKLVDTVGWRGAYLCLSGIVGIGMTLIGWLFFRDNPEECGLVMDGVTDETWLAKMRARVPEANKEFTRAEAIRTPAFWVFNAATASIAMIVTAIHFHIVSLGAEAGLDRSASYALFIPAAFFGPVANFIAGWWGDRYELKWVLFAMMIAHSTGLAGLLTLDNLVGQWMFIVGYGSSLGFFGNLLTVTWPRFYGRTHVGAISGLNVSVTVFASALGPVLFSVARDITGSFQTIGKICIAVMIVILLFARKADNPQKRTGL